MPPPPIDQTDRNAVKRAAQEAANRSRTTQFLRAYTTPAAPTTQNYKTWFAFDDVPNPRHIGEAIYPTKQETF